MKLVMMTLAMVALTGAAEAQQQWAPELTPLEQAQPGIEPADTQPKKAPPGELCLIEAPKRCSQDAELIRRPYTGGGALYYLEKNPAKTQKTPSDAPSLKQKPS